MFDYVGLEVASPLKFEALTVYPLLGDPRQAVDYRLGQDALAEGLVAIDEINEAGSVPELVAENSSPWHILFVEGEELVGAKQNRVLNTSLLIPPTSRVVIPVSCVERGRWSHSQRSFASGGHSPSSLRRRLKSSVANSLRAQQRHRSDQGGVWEEVDALHAAHEVDSASAAMSDAYRAKEDVAAICRERMRLPAGTVGVVVALGASCQTIDLFDSSATCQKIWLRQIPGLALEATVQPAASPPEVDAVRELVAEFTTLPWEATPVVGAGSEWRARSVRGDEASALTFHGALVHGSAVLGLA